MKSGTKEYKAKWARDHREVSIKWANEHPWWKNYKSAQQRCCNPNNNSYYRYGGMGVKFLMTLEDFKFLWFRDKAYLMNKPTIDRKDSLKDYTLKNCQYIEHADNSVKRVAGNQYVNRKTRELECSCK